MGGGAGCCGEAANYCPVSLFSICCKLLEHTMRLEIPTIQLQKADRHTKKNNNNKKPRLEQS